MSRPSPKVAISLVTTVLNDRTSCMKFFEQMAIQTRLPAEIVIVDGGSLDGTWEFLQQVPTQEKLWKLQVRQELGCNVARGRNLAIMAATHELIVSTDLGCDWDPEWLAELIAPFELDSGVQAVMGSWSIREEDLVGEWARVEYAFLRQPKFVATNRSNASSRSIAYTRDLWKRIGGYPEDLTIAGDDMVYALLLHRSTSSNEVAAASTPRCHWERPSRFRAFQKEARRNFRGAGEAGIFLGYGIKVGGRIVIEVVLLAVGFTALVAGAVWWTAVVWLILSISVLMRVRRLQSSVAIARRLNVHQPWMRLFLFEYAVKIWAIIGLCEGWFQGRQQCADCRRRLRKKKARQAKFLF